MSIRARVRCEIEVPVGLWNESTSFAEIKEQVRKEGANIVTKAAKFVHGVVVGVPHVVIVVMDDRGDGEQ